MSPHRVVAIDGPAASGKSSVARELARRLGFVYINSGAMYRAATWHVLEHGVAPMTAAAIARLHRTRRQSICDLEQNESRILFDEIDPANFLRDDRVNEASRASAVFRASAKFSSQKCAATRTTATWSWKAATSARLFFPIRPTSFTSTLRRRSAGSRRAAQGQRDQIAARDRADSSRARITAHHRGRRACHR